MSKIPTLRAGQSYERRVSAFLERSYGMVPQVEFELTQPGASTHRSRFIPDGLLFSPSYAKLVVVEIKTQNSEEASTQLRSYVRYLSSWFPGPVSGLLVCGSLRKWLGLDYELVESPLDAFAKPYCLLALSARLLPRARDGLKLDPPNASYAVPAPGGSRSDVNRSELRLVMAPPS